MKVKIYQILTFSLALLLLGCNVNPGTAVSDDRSSEQALLLDSLQKFDSLVLKHRAKNTGEAIECANQSVSLAMIIHTPSARAKAFRVLGNAYSLVSADSGIYFYQKAMMVIDSFNLDDQKGKVLYSLARMNRLKGNYKNSIQLINSALNVSMATHDFATISNALNSIGTLYQNLGEDISARKMFDSAYSIAERNSLYLQMGCALGNLSRFEKDPQRSVRMQKLAISYMEKGDDAAGPVAQSLINIGYRMQNPDSAIHYYQEAIDLVSNDYAPEVIIGAYNNMAYIYIDKGDLKMAEKCITEQALPLAVRTEDLDWLSSVYDTYGDVLAAMGKKTEADVYKRKAVETRRSFKDSILLYLTGNK